VTERPSIDQTWLTVAGVIAQRGTCDRLHVGAVLTRDGRVVATGWNGAPAGQPHCAHDGLEESCTVSIHAERNVVGFAARFGIATGGTRLYVTHAPCLDCASVLVAAGVDSVVYGSEYRSLAGVRRLRECGVTVLSRAEVMFE
jgi:dCMP deaminase